MAGKMTREELLKRRQAAEEKQRQDFKLVLEGLAEADRTFEKLNAEKTALAAEFKELESWMVKLEAMEPAK